MFDKESFKWFLSKSITLYCKSILPNSSFRVDVMIGITVNDADLATLVCFSESIVTGESELESQNTNNQVAIENAVKQENGELASRSELKFATNRINDTATVGANVSYNANSSIEEILEARIHQSKQKTGRFSENNLSKHEVQPEIKQELLDNPPGDMGDDDDDGENNYDEDCYVDEQEVENDEMPQSSYNQESWNEGDNWNDMNYTQNETNSNNLSMEKQHLSQKPGRRTRVQRVKIEQAMESYGQGMLPSSSEYTNLMQDICTSMVNQSTELSKKKSGIQGSLSSTSPVTCHICHATLSNTLCLRNHIQGTHLALKLKKCNLCGETFKWPMQLARHKKRVHGGGNYFTIYK